MGLNRIHLLMNGHQFRKKDIHRCRLLFSCQIAQPIWPKSIQDQLHLWANQIRSINLLFFFPGVRPFITSKSKKQTHALAFFSLISYSLCDMAAWQRYRSRGACLMSIVKALVIYHKVASSNTSRLETHPGVFRLLMKRISDAYAL